MSPLQQISRIIEDDYGVGIIACAPVTCLWAAERCDDPRKALKALNRRRAKYGAPLAYAPFGHVAF